MPTLVIPMDTGGANSPGSASKVPNDETLLCGQGWLGRVWNMPDGWQISSRLSRWCTARCWTPAVVLGDETLTRLELRVDV